MLGAEKQNKHEYDREHDHISFRSIYHLGSDLHFLTLPVLAPSMKAVHWQCKGAVQYPYGVITSIGMPIPGPGGG